MFIFYLYSSEYCYNSSSYWEATEAQVVEYLDDWEEAAAEEQADGAAHCAQQVQHRGGGQHGNLHVKLPQNVVDTFNKGPLSPPCAVSEVK